MQVLALIGMEPPASVDAKGIRDEKVKLVQAVEILDAAGVAQDVVRAQYMAGIVRGLGAVPGYREEPGVAPDSMTETFVAMKLSIDNWRWAGVPFYVRTGKRLAERATEVALQFQPVPHLRLRAPLKPGACTPTALLLRIQPDEGICLRVRRQGPRAGLHRPLGRHGLLLRRDLPEQPATTATSDSSTTP